MELTKRNDALVAAAISLLLPIVVLTRGDPLFIGLWYYLAIPAFVIATGLYLQAEPAYLTGAALAVACAFLIYMMINYTAARPEGLLGLGHLFSIPGGLIGHLLGIKLSRRYSGAQAMLTAGVLGWGLGFFINQLGVCNTVMYCGPLSLFR